MASTMTAENDTSYTELTIEATPDAEALSGGATQAKIFIDIYITEDTYTTHTTPDYSYGESADFIALTDDALAEQTIKDEDIDSGLSVLPDGVYEFTVKFYDDTDTLVSGYDATQLSFINYSIGIPIAQNTIAVALQLEEEDYEHLRDSLYAMWYETCYVATSRAASTTLMDDSLKILEYTQNLLEND